jgi:hypothetical protein
MRVRRVALLILVTSIIAGACQPLRTQNQARHFSLILDHSAPGYWAARCETGCKWQTVSMTCSNCAVQIDETGIGPSDTRNTNHRFAFVIRDIDGKWQAKGVSGVHWLDLSYGCSNRTPCRARVDETGVAGI